MTRSADTPLLSSALVMIARNEAASIGRCLHSVRPVVDTMIVVDTGSQDDTVAVSRDLGARVLHLDWCDDFAAARNFALDQSPADWNLVLDADEWIDGDAGALRAALQSPDDFIGVLPVASQFDLADQLSTSTSWIPRLLPRGVRYTGRIHEQPESPLPRRRLDCTILHDGYRQATLQRKKGRNRKLLQQMLAQQPDDPYLLYQLGRDYEVYEDFDQAIDCFDRALAGTPGDAIYRHDLVIRTLYSLKMGQLFEPAMQFAEQEMPNWEGSPDFYFALGDLLLDWATAHPEQALDQLLPMIEASWLRCLEIGEQPGLEGSVAGRGSHLAAHNLSVLYAGTGDKARAAEFAGLAATLRKETTGE